MYKGMKNRKDTTHTEKKKKNHVRILNTKLFTYRVQKYNKKWIAGKFYLANEFMQHSFEVKSKMTKP